jgi:hypothetical protein
MTVPAEFFFCRDTYFPRENSFAQMVSCDETAFRKILLMGEIPG